jgi:hypothetical protein
LIGFFTAVLALEASPRAWAQDAKSQSCGEPLTEQLRRFNEQCIADLVAFIAATPDLSARISGEAEKFYVALNRHDGRLVAEAVSKFNYPLIKADAPDRLKQLGWSAPESEADNWKKDLGDGARGGDAARIIADALGAYGLKPGEAMSLTVTRGTVK